MYLNLRRGSSGECALALELRWRGIVASLLLLCSSTAARADVPGWLSTPRGQVAGAPVVQPGQRLGFQAFDLATGVPLLPGGIEVCVTYPSDSNPVQGYSGPLNVALIGSTAVDGAACTSFAFSDFKVAPSPSGAATPVQAYISGAFEATGMMALVGMGRIEASFWVDLLDVTEPNAPRVVASRTIASASLDSQSLLNINMGLSVDGGSATLIQLGVNPEVGIPIGVQVKRVRLIEGINFDAQLQRGRTYRIQANASGRVLAGPGGGVGAAVFIDEIGLLGGQPLPDVLSREYWLQRLSAPVEQGGIGLDLKLPRVNLQSVANRLPSLRIPSAGIVWPSGFHKIASVLKKLCEFFLDDDQCTGLSMPYSTQFWSQLTIIDPSSLLQSVVPDSDNDGQRTSNDVLKELSLPTDLTGLFKVMLSAADKVFGTLEDWINANRGGAKFTDLAVTIMNDEVQILADQQADATARFDAVDDALNDVVANLDQANTEILNAIDDKRSVLADQLSQARTDILGAIGASSDALSSLVEQRFTELNQKFDGFIDESTRIRIQQSLSSQWPVVEFMLPAQHGGKLEMLAQVVNDAMAQMIAAGQDVGPAAFEIQTAELYWSHGEYKRAYSAYVRAYRAISTYPQ